MGLDIRLPLGLLFATIGLILVVYGALTQGSVVYAMTGGLNLNLIWGSLMTAVGVLMVWLGRRR